MLKTNLVDNQILSRQIFQIAFNEFEKLTKSEQKAFDAKRAREIVADNILPSNKDILQDLEDLYKSMYGETMSDRRKTRVYMMKLLLNGHLMYKL